MKAVEVNNLRKSYPKKIPLPFRKVEWVEAVKGISFEVKRGELFGLLGPNGAGKTTTIKMLTTLLEPSGGSAKILGLDLIRDAREIRKRINLVAEGERTLYWRLSAYENLKYFARIYYVPKSEMEKRIEELLKLVGLWERRNDLVMSYSRGMKQRLAIAKALINDPEVLFLDEPTLGLDVQSALFVRDFVKRLVKEEGKTVLLTTHYMVEAEELCDRIAIIDHGRIIALDTPEGLKKLVKDEETVEIAVREFNPALLEKSPWKLAVVQSTEERTVLRGSVDEEDLPKLVEWLVKNQVKVVSVERKEPTLEDVFIKLTGRGLRD
ncbi:ABC-type multidrug transport system, ATPase component [Thermococcus kodakarensis KOD1]|uniref:ABC-type multidrug transport system, ATPase component n=1 Tax=Thermococcus kodakarensis (strain ATCC BAA-918 / JCM 12380 / KOD1) TaxID=69014 RepID=Q5JDD3_THEKO|nr:daunorubicin resistance protein DrrA family ABC transporter ATP-binding protein [Thermococcus kodakarensis]WCN27894.1 daunorubicin resistance protein DrrA family ABC transporter ATP-binding protein [Thermococcus kodakarensis]WCN30192.1 daunorubicin resistance protein DrrA family ABC transporter ATP-binding protein [Thermococcus kodakarensis]BAD86215.1 ABC-type multidrug transport system, ATPase component [Thermococcus kodakarensis KOD1]